MNDLKKKFGIVTGATGGIGKEISIALAKQGVNLLLLARDKEKLSELSNELGRYCSCNYYTIDLSASLALNEFFEFVHQKKILPDLLIHAAGQFYHNEIVNSQEADLDSVFAINYKAPFLITKQFIDAIVEKKGSIVFINSTDALSPKMHSALYSSSKSALRTFADVLHKEVHHLGVRVLSVFPGRVDTKMQQLATSKEGLPYQPSKYLSPQIIADMVVQNLMLPPQVSIAEVIIRPSLSST